jgi:hypothetical protein
VPLLAALEAQAVHPAAELAGASTTSSVGVLAAPSSGSPSVASLWEEATCYPSSTAPAYFSGISTLPFQSATWPAVGASRWVSMGVPIQLSIGSPPRLFFSRWPMDWSTVGYDEEARSRIPSIQALRLFERPAWMDDPSAPAPWERGKRG